MISANISSGAHGALEGSGIAAMRPLSCHPAIRREMARNDQTVLGALGVGGRLIRAMIAMIAFLAVCHFAGVGALLAPFVEDAGLALAGMGDRIFWGVVSVGCLAAFIPYRRLGLFPRPTRA